MPTHLINKSNQSTKKQWTKEEKHYAHHVLTKKTTHPDDKLAETMQVWVIILSVFLASLIALTVTIPFLAIFSKYFVFTFIFIIGILFGLMFDHVFRDVEHKHHIHHQYILYVLIPAFAIMFGILFSAYIISTLKLNASTSLLFGLIYFIGFYSPIFGRRLIHIDRAHKI